MLLPLLVSCFHLVLLGFPAASLPHPLGHAASYLVLFFHLGYHSAASSRYLQLVQFASFCPTHTSSLWLHHAKLRQVCFLGELHWTRYNIHYVLPKKLYQIRGLCQLWINVSLGKVKVKERPTKILKKYWTVCWQPFDRDIQLYVILGCESYPVTLWQFTLFTIKYSCQYNSCHRNNQCIRNV